MTDRINALTVVLDTDVRDDDAESLCEAIMHFRHVIKVEKNVSDIEATVAQTRVRRELVKNFHQLLRGNRRID